MRATLAGLASLCLAGGVGATEIAAPCESAGFILPTDRYAHCVLGDCIEWGGMAMKVTVAGNVQAEYAVELTAEVILPEERVFEDVAPRCAELGRDGTLHVIVVESDARRGAQLAAYAPALGADGLALNRIAATEPIGRPFRWLAPAGIADFDGDGQADVAFVDRPHLARILRIVTLRGDRFEEIATAAGLSNHRIGDRNIAGGVRDCGDGPEIITADAAWSRVVATRLVNGGPVSRDLGPLGEGAFRAALDCGI